MIREAILSEMTVQGVKQTDLVDAIATTGTKITRSRVCNFLNGKTSINIEVLQIIFEVLQIELIRKIKTN